VSKCNDGRFCDSIIPVCKSHYSGLGGAVSVPLCSLSRALWILSSMVTQVGEVTGEGAVATPVALVAGGEGIAAAPAVVIL